MNRDQAPSCAAVFAVAFFLIVSGEPRNCRGAERPNLIVVFTDDHGYSDLSSQGVFDDVKTPHIDALAASGARMTNGYCSAPQCVPSRAGLLTGKYQNRFGVESNGVDLSGFNAEPTIAERLQSAGYATGMIGKWHLGPVAEIVKHGFDDVFYRGGSWTNFDFDGRDVKPGTVNNDRYHLDAGSAAAKAFIQRHHAEPFFLYLAYRAPHVPLDATQRYLDRFPEPMPARRRQALAMLSAVDDGVGGIIESLREHGIEDKTLIFLIGDNGAPLKIHKDDAPGGGPGWDGSLNDPLNGEKGMLSEGGIRVPFVVSWKGKIKPGQVFQQPVISLDVAATAVSLAGLQPVAELDGVDLLPYLTGEQIGAPHRELYWRWIAQSAIREGDWKYLRGGRREYLFDLSKDREEKDNLREQFPEVAERLRAKLESWSQTLDPPGIETKQMSTTWESYFDFYLDGKPAPPRPKKRSRSDSVAGWVVRNAQAEVRDGRLIVKPSASAKPPFLARAGLSFSGPLTVELDVVPRGDGRLGVSWRRAGQADFSPNQVVQTDCRAAQRLTCKLDVPEQEKLIHARLLLPASGAEIISIRFSTPEGRRLAAWRFETRK